MESTAINIGTPQLICGYFLLIIPVFLILFYRVRLMKEFMISLVFNRCAQQAVTRRVVGPALAILFLVIPGHMKVSADILDAGRTVFPVAFQQVLGT